MISIFHSNIGNNGIALFLHYPFFLPNSLRLKRELSLNLRLILIYILRTCHFMKNAI